jgi:hypothetical protein
MNAFEKYVNEMNGVLNERSIKAIQNEFSEVVNKMATLAKEFAAAEGDVKTNILAELKGLTAKKNALISELDAEVAGKDKDVQLVIKESEVNEASRKSIKKYNGLTYLTYYEAPKGYSVNGIGELSGVVGSPEFFETEKEAQEYAEEQIKDYLGEATVTEAYGKSAGLTKDETLEIAQKFADAMSKVDGTKVTVNKRTLEEDSFDLDVDGEEFDGGSYNIYQNGNVMNMALRENPVYGKKTDSVDTIAKNMKKFMAESIVSEGEVLVFDEIGTELESLKKKISELMRSATDKKWVSALSAASSTLSGLDMKLSQADSKLGAIITESEVNEAEKFKSTKDFEEFCEEIDGMPEVRIKRIMGKDYIDTPGGYRDEAEDYDNDITEYMISNMGRKDFEELKSWWENNVQESVVNETGFKKSDIKKTIDFINKEIGIDPGYALIGDEDDIEEFDKLWDRGEYEDAFDFLTVATNMEISTLDDVKKILSESKVTESKIKKGSVVIPYASSDGEFVVDKVFKNKDGEDSYTGEFKKTGKKMEYIFHDNDKIIKESSMGDIDIMAQEAKDFKTFVKEFTKQYHNLSNAGEPGQFNDWLQSIYDTAKENMDESVISEEKAKDLKTGVKYSSQYGEVFFVRLNPDGKTMKLWSKETGNIKTSVDNAYDMKLVEARHITVKRQYTENHPASMVGKVAAVRNKVLEAIKDGKISTEQFEKIVSDFSNNSKRWTRSNSKYFTISEDGVMLSSLGKKVLSGITVNEADFKEFPKGYNPEVWVPGNFDKDISKYPNAKLTRKIVLDAAKKWDVTPEDAIKYVEFGWHVDLSENKNNNNMKTKFIFESFSEFVSSIKESNQFLNEAFASTKLASLLTGANAMPKDLPQAFYNMAKLALDKIQDVDIIELDPQSAKKEKRASAVYLYFTTNEKPNPYAGKETWSGDRTIPANTLLAITDGSNEWMNAEWNSRGRSRQAQNDGRVLTTTKRDDSAGINKSGANVNYGTGISSMKQVAELADRAYCLDLTILTARYSTSALKAERDMARKGATALMDPRTFKDANKARYNEILAQKAAAMPIDKIVLDAIDALSNQIKDALIKGEKSKYDDILIGLNPKGKEVKLSDASNLMRNILDDYQRYVGDVAQSEKEVAAGYGTSYYDRSLKERSKNIIDNVKKIENKNYAW